MRVGMLLDTSPREGVHVKLLEDGGVAAAAGVCVGAVVQAVDGVRVTDHAQGARLISAAQGQVVVTPLRPRGPNCNAQHVAMDNPSAISGMSAQAASATDGGGPGGGAAGGDGNTSREAQTPSAQVGLVAVLREVLLTSVELTEEQRERMERNRLAALARY